MKSCCFGRRVLLVISFRAEKVKNKVNKEVNIIHKQLPEDDPKQRKPDISMAKKILNWEPTVDLELGLDLTINYFKNVI